MLLFELRILANLPNHPQQPQWIQNMQEDVLRLLKSPFAGEATGRLVRRSGTSRRSFEVKYGEVLGIIGRNARARVRC